MEGLIKEFRVCVSVHITPVSAPLKVINSTADCDVWQIAGDCVALIMPSPLKNVP